MMSWIDREDVLRMIEWSIDHGFRPRNLQCHSPQPRDQPRLRSCPRTRSPPSVDHAHAAFALRLALGSEMADEMLLAGNASFPIGPIAEGFEFTIRTWTKHLRHALCVK